MERSDSRASNFSPIPSKGDLGRSRKGTIITPVLEALEQSGGDGEVTALISTARQDAKKLEFETSLINYSRAAQLLVRGSDILSLSRVLLEAGDVAIISKSLDFGEATLRDCVSNYLRCVDVVEDDAVVHKEFVEAVKCYASVSATKSQTQVSSDKRVYLESTRRAFHLYDWALRLLDPSGSDVSTAVLGSLSSLGQLAAHLQCYDWALDFFERNMSIKEVLGIETESIRKHIDKVSDRLTQVNASRDAIRAANFREESEKMFLAEFRERTELSFLMVKSHVKFIRSIPPPPQSSLRGALRGRPSSGDSAIHTFFKTGNFTGLTPQQELDAFRADVEEGKSLVKAKQLEDAQDHFTAAVQLAASSFSIPLEDHRAALGSLAYVYCMRAQTENEKGSKEYRKMMMRSVPHYKKVVEMTEERIALKQSSLQEEVSLASTYLQLGVVAVSLDRLETGLFYMRKAKGFREKFRMDATQEDRHILTVEKSVRKRDAELLAHATQLAEARKQTIAVDRPSFAQCVAWYTTAKALMQQRRCEEAEPLLLEALIGFESLMGVDPSIRKRSEYRLTLTGLGASYYFLGQEHGKKTTNFNINNEQALVYYHQALQGLLNDAAPDGSDDVAIASLQFHVACCYANLRRYDVASINFQKSRDVKSRVGLNVEDIDVNLDALYQRLEALIDEDTIRQASVQAKQAAAAAAAAAAGGGTHPLTTSNVNSLPSQVHSNNSSNNSTPRELNLSNSGNFDSPRSTRRGNRAVSFLLPTDNASDVDSMENSTTDLALSSPTSRSESPKLHLTGSILVESTFASSFGSPKVSGYTAPTPAPPPFSLGASAIATAVVEKAPPLRTPAFPQPDSAQILMMRIQHMEELARDIAADLWVPASRAISFISQEERKERMDLFAALDVVWRNFLVAQQRGAVALIAKEFVAKMEEMTRKRLVAEYHKLWLHLALGRVSGSEQIGRQKIVAEHRRVVSLPSADHQDKMTNNQESIARSRILFAQRIAFFELIEVYQRERIDALQRTARREVLVVPRLVDAALVSKQVMFKGAFRLVLAQNKQCVMEGETLDRFGILFREQHELSLLLSKRSVGSVEIQEAQLRSKLLFQERCGRLEDLVERFGRSFFLAQQRSIARYGIRYPMLREELMVREKVARREVLQKPEAVLYLSNILQPVLEMHEKHLRRTIWDDWHNTLTISIGLPMVSSQEAAIRKKIMNQNRMQLSQLRTTAVVRLEEIGRKDHMLQWKAEMILRVGKSYIVEQEQLRRQLFINNEYYRVFAAIAHLERGKRLESVAESEKSKRRVLRMLHDEGFTKMFIEFESSLRNARDAEQRRGFATMQAQQQRELLILRETLLRRVGERLAHDQRLKQVMMVMGPETLAAHFRFVATRKLRSIETHFRNIMYQIHHRSLALLCRQGLQVLATSAMRETMKLEARHRLEEIQVPFLVHTEVVKRQELAIRHGEVLSLLFADKRRSAHMAVSDGEYKGRKYNTDLEDKHRLLLLQKMQQSAAMALEDERRRLILEEQLQEHRSDIRNPAQLSKFVVREAEHRRIAEGKLTKRRLEETLAPVTYFIQNDLAHRAMAEVMCLAEVEFRHCISDTEELAEREVLQRECENLHNRCRLESDEEASRKELFDEFAAPFNNEFSALMHQGEMEVRHAMLLVEESSGRNLVAIQESMVRLENVECPATYDMDVIERFMEDRRSLDFLSSMSSSQCEEKTARRLMASAIMLDHTENITHKIELAMSFFELDEASHRLALFKEEEQHLTAAQTDFFRSGQMIVLELHEMMERQRVAQDQYERICVMQHVAFTEERDRECCATEHIDRLSIRALEEREWINVEVEVSHDMITRMEGITITDMAQAFRREQCIIEESIAAASLELEECDEHASILVQEHMEAAEMEFMLDATHITFEAESTFRHHITASWEVSHVSELDVIGEQLLFLHSESTVREAIEAEQLRVALSMTDEASMDTHRLAVRTLLIEESSRRSVVEMDEAESAEELARWRHLELPQLCSLAGLIDAQESIHRHQLSIDCESADRSTLFALFSIFVKEVKLREAFDQQQLIADSLRHRSLLELDEQSVMKQREVEWNSLGSWLLLLLRESTVRSRLTTETYQAEVAIPLELGWLDHIVYHDSFVETVAAAEERERLDLCIQLVQCNENDARLRHEAAAAAHNDLLTDWAKEARMIFAEKSDDWMAITRASQESMHNHVAALVWHESNLRCNQVMEWSARQCHATMSASLLSDYSSVLRQATEEVAEPHQREKILADRELALATLRCNELCDAEAIQRSEFDILVDLHQIQLQEYALRCNILSEYHEGVFYCRFGPILDQLHIERTHVELTMMVERAVLDKQIMLEHFSTIQCRVVMTEFVVRQETISRIQTIVSVERKEWMRLLNSGGAEDGDRTPRTPIGARGSVLFQRRGLPKLPPLPNAPPAFLLSQTPPAGKKGLLPLAAEVAAVSPFDKKKSRKHIAAIATSEECLIREALNIRPSSASAAGTPRTPKTSGRIVLKPLPSAMVTFKKSDVAEAATMLLLQQLSDELRRTLTIESFQRYVVEEQQAKVLVQLCAAAYTELFQIVADDEMAFAMEDIAEEIFESMSIGL